MKRAVIAVGLALILSACSSSATDPAESALPTRVTLVLATDAPTIPPAPSATAENVLQFWEARDAELRADAPDRWQFKGTSGDAITVRVVGVAALLTLRAENGAILQSAEEIRATLPEDGVYTVIVQALDPDAPSAAYQIGLGYADRPNPNRVVNTLVPEVVGVPTPTPAYGGLGTFISQLENNQTLGGTITDADTPHIYTFAATAGDYVRVELRYVSGEINPQVTLYSPHGVPIAIDSDSGGDGIAQLHNVRLAEDGLYMIQAAGNAPGGYSVKLFQYADFAPVTPDGVTLPPPTAIPTFAVPTAARAIPGTRLQDHLPVVDILSAAADVDIYALYLSEGEVVTLGGNPIDGSNVRLRLEVLNPEGLIVASADADSNGDSLIAPLRADITGVYQVFVTASTADFGAYSISYGGGSSRFDVGMGTPLRDTPTQGVIRRRGARDVWTLELRAGDIITVGINPADFVLDPIVDIAPASDPKNTLAVDDNSGGDRAAFIQQVTIPATGLYLIRVKASQAASIGPYTLVWRYINVAPTPTYSAPTYPILTLQEAVADSAYAFYPFYGRAGQSVRVRVEAISAGFDPVAALLAPDGRVWAEADDSDGTLNPAFVAELPVDGTYNIRVNGYISGGDFTLVVEEVFPPIIPPTPYPTAVPPTVTPSATLDVDLP